MDYSKIKSLYLEQIKTISTLLDNQEFVNLIKENELLRTNFVDQISVLRFLEKRLTDTKLIEKQISESKKKKQKLDLIEIKDLDKSDIYMKKFKELSSSSAEFNEFEEVKKTEDIKDTIKYLDVFLKNTFNKDLKYFLENKPSEETVKAEKIEDNFEPQLNENQSFESNKSGMFGGGMFGNGMFGGPTPNVSYENFVEQQLMGLASGELRNQITSGKFYLYKTKPKIMLFLKNILGSLLILTSLVWVLVLITQSITTSLQAKSLSAMWYGDPNDSTPIVLDAGNTFFTYILYILLICCFAFTGYKYLVNKKNENTIYGFDKRAAIMYIVLMLIISGTFIFYLVTWIPHIDAIKSLSVGTYIPQNSSSSNSPSSVTVTNSPTAVITFQICTWAILSGLILFVLLITGFIIAWINAPKIDEERIQLKTQELIKEIKETPEFKNSFKQN